MPNGPTVIGSRGPMRSASRPARADRASMRTVTGSVARPACMRRVAEHLLEMDDEQEERDAEAGVHDEGDEVGGGELPRAEDVERQHRVTAVPLHGDEAGQRGQPAAPDRQRRPARAVLAGLNQRPGHPGQAQQRSAPRPRRRCRGRMPDRASRGRGAAPRPRPRRRAAR